MGFEEFLKETTPVLGLQWRPFRRKGIKRKIERRIAQVGLSGFAEYWVKVKEDPKEQRYLLKILTVTISRFFRDQEVFSAIETFVIPALLKKKENDNLRVWSIGCASGEEPYSLSILWKKRFEKIWPRIHFSILATDIDEGLLKRAREGRFKKSSLTEGPEEILRNYFKDNNGFYTLDMTIQESVEFRRHDIILEEPFSGMDIVFCRNLAFTYFSKECQMDVLKKIADSLGEGGYLVIGKDESLPLAYPTLFVTTFPNERVYQKFNSQLD